MLTAPVGSLVSRGRWTRRLSTRNCVDRRPTPLIARACRQAALLTARAERNAHVARMHPHRSRSAVDEDQLRSTRTSGECPGNGSRAFDTSLQTIILPVRRAAHCHHRRISAKRCSRIEQREQRREVSRPRGCEKRAHEFVVPLRHGITAGGCAAHAAACAACELPRRLGRPSDDRGDVVKRHVEHVVQHKCNALRRRQRIEQDQQGHANRIGENRFFLGAFAGSDCDNVATRIIRRQVLAPACAPFQRIEAGARNNGRQPAFEIRNTRNVRAADAQSALLQRVVGFGSRSQYALRNALQARPSRLKALREPLRILQSIRSCGARHVSPRSIRHRDGMSMES